MRGGAYTRGVYTWSNTSVKVKVGLSGRGLYAGGAYRRRNMVRIYQRLDQEPYSLSSSYFRFC